MNPLLYKILRQWVVQLEIVLFIMFVQQIACGLECE